MLYLAARRLTEARDALDRVPDRHPEYAMALFKRAQVSVLLGEADLFASSIAKWLDVRHPGPAPGSCPRLMPRRLITRLSSFEP